MPGIRFEGGRVEILTSSIITPPYCRLVPPHAAQPHISQPLFAFCSLATGRGGQSEAKRSEPRQKAGGGVGAKLEPSTTRRSNKAEQISSSKINKQTNKNTKQLNGSIVHTWFPHYADTKTESSDYAFYCQQKECIYAYLY